MTLIYIHLHTNLMDLYHHQTWPARGAALKWALPCTVTLSLRPTSSSGNIFTCLYWRIFTKNECNSFQGCSFVISTKEIQNFNYFSLVLAALFQISCVSSVKWRMTLCPLSNTRCLCNYTFLSRSWAIIQFKLLWIHFLWNIFMFLHLNPNIGCWILSILKVHC